MFQYGSVAVLPECREKKLSPDGGKYTSSRGAIRPPVSRRRCVGHTAPENWRSRVSCRSSGVIAGGGCTGLEFARCPFDRESHAAALGAAAEEIAAVSRLVGIGIARVDR
ncbi:MAG: hypothetical protein ACLUQ6_09380 [Alistipes onderdonkii]